jgi:hypothetical protein
MSAAASSAFAGFHFRLIGLGRFLVHLGLLALRVCIIDAVNETSLQRKYGPPMISDINPAENPPSASTEFRMAITANQ